MSLRQLLADRKLHEELCRDPELVDAAVEEGMRTATGLRYLRRTSAEDTRIGGQDAQSSAAALPFIEAANHDPERFDSHTQFRLDWGSVGSRHLTFGPGRHVCLAGSAGTSHQPVPADRVSRHWGSPSA